LNDIEKDIYFLVAQAYIAQFYLVHVYNQTRVEIEHASESFTASGRIITELGWKELYRAETEEKKNDDSIALPAMEKGDTADFICASAEKKSTRAPVRFTAATLLAAMKEIHKYVKILI